MRALWIIFLLALMPVFPAAGEVPRMDLSLIEGVYRQPLNVEPAQGTRDQAEGMLEVVGVSSRLAYIRLSLTFENGQSCDMWGLADVGTDELVHRRPQTIWRNACVLRVRFGSERITFEDVGRLCRLRDCGVQGGYDAAGFTRQTRQPIIYMDRLLGSREYREAITEPKGRDPLPR